MAKLDLDWLGVFVEVYQTQNVSRAAERLGIAQATASIALAKMRRHFGDRLFVRTSRGMEPTPRAQLLYPELVQVLARLESLRTEGARFEPARAARCFRIAMTDISEVVLLPGLLAHLREAAPGVQVEAHTSTADTARQLESGEIDLAVGFMPQLEAGFHQQVLFSQDFVCLAAREHPRVRGRLTRRLFAAEAHVVVVTSGTGHAVVDRALARHGLERRAALRVPSFLGVARVVARTELLAVVPRLLGETVASQEPVQLLDPPVTLPGFEVRQHWHERFHDDAGLAWLRRTMAERFASGSRRATPRAPVAERSAASQRVDRNVGQAVGSTGRRGAHKPPGAGAPG